MSWYVCDMDEGVLRVEATRSAALKWWLDYNGGHKVIERYTYAPGSYSYTTGFDREDCDSIYIGTDAGATAHGWDVSDTPRYPYPDRPYEEAPSC